eukprot:TRINITY_DN14793_c0_g2_i1.p1 TRINITY_DN14793_c0_g2~~TRINITY_DN14793_c0_g2_i1.p1  ORF type:complete len:114 (-),score=19.43 TRINITY_DN14793_c0_g2_i1:195-536(-)
MSSSMSDRLKEYHRNLRPKRGEELSMKQVATFFGGLYAVIHMLQYFDLWTLLLLITIAYVIYRQALQIYQLIMQANQEGAEQQDENGKGAGRGNNKSGGVKSRGTKKGGRPEK